MSRYLVLAWNQGPDRHAIKESKVYTSRLDLVDRLMKIVHMKYPRCWVDCIDLAQCTAVRFKGKVIKSMAPKGSDKRDRLKREIESQGGKFIFGTMELPVNMYRRGKGDVNPREVRRKKQRRRRPRARRGMDFQGLSQVSSRFKRD